MKPGDKVKITKDAFVLKVDGEAVEVILEGHSYSFWTNSSFLEVIERPEPPRYSVVVVKSTDLHNNYVAFKRYTDGWYVIGYEEAFNWDYVRNYGEIVEVYPNEER
jgi:hypothetical protein